MQQSCVNPGEMLAEGQADCVAERLEQLLFNEQTDWQEPQGTRMAVRKLGLLKARRLLKKTLNRLLCWVAETTCFRGMTPFIKSKWQ